MSHQQWWKESIGKGQQTDNRKYWAWIVWRNLLTIDKTTDSTGTTKTVRQHDKRNAPNRIIANHWNAQQEYGRYNMSYKISEIDQNEHSKNDVLYSQIIDAPFRINIFGIFLFAVK